MGGRIRGWIGGDNPDLRASVAAFLMDFPVSRWKRLRRT